MRWKENEETQKCVYCYVHQYTYRNRTGLTGWAWISWGWEVTRKKNTSKPTKQNKKNEEIMTKKFFKKWWPSVSGKEQRDSQETCSPGRGRSLKGVAYAPLSSFPLLRSWTFFCVLGLKVAESGANEDNDADTNAHPLGSQAEPVVTLGALLHFLLLLLDGRDQLLGPFQTFLSLSWTMAELTVPVVTCCCPTQTSFQSNEKFWTIFSPIIRFLKILSCQHGKSCFSFKN